MDLLWYHWEILGILLMITELIVPAFVLVWFGLGAIVVGSCMSLFPAMGLTMQLQIWLSVSVLLVVAWFKIFKPAQHKSLVGRSSAEAVGEEGLLTEEVQPFQKGRVRFQKPLMGSDVWDCIADEAIKAGVRVKVLSVEGSMLKIKQKGD